MFITYLILYLLLSYWYWTFNLLELTWLQRFSIIIFIILIGSINLMTIYDNENYFEKETTKEKKTKMEKYTWELEEELRIYNKAVKLKKEVDNIKKANNLK